LLNQIKEQAKDSSIQSTNNCEFMVPICTPFPPSKLSASRRSKTGQHSRLKVGNTTKNTYCPGQLKQRPAGAITDKQKNCLKTPKLGQNSCITAAALSCQ
jgi:hypothetical protein